jgi:ribosomal protein L37E
MPKRSRLSDEQIADLTAWVARGVPWPAEGPKAGPTGKEAFDLKERMKHWAWQPVKALPPPAVRSQEWVRTPVDVFLLAKLEEAGLTPAAAADKRTLLRRVTSDLTGLPPTPQEIDAFLADDAADAYEKVVDRLLASPAYGERWGRHWLDLVRFAETYGHEFDFDIADAYQYRDYVTRAFNDDVPYDQFVREHVAGDLLPRPRRHSTEGFNESVIATGFWWFGEAKHSPVDSRGDQADRIDNQIDVFGKTFLGLTLACARCHDHKFDAITQKDYYALCGYLQSSRLQRAAIDPSEKARAALVRLNELNDQARTLAVAESAKVLTDNAERLAQRLLNGRLKRAEWLEFVRTQATVPGRDPKATVFEDFGGETFRGWYVSGEAFGTGPTRGTEVVLQADQRSPVRQLVGAGLAHGGLMADRLTWTLRSKIRDPIYGGLTFSVNSGDRMEWRVQDVSAWIGHRAYVEVLDDGPGHAILDQVLFSDGGPPADVPNSVLTRVLDDETLTDPEAVAGQYKRLLLEVVEQWRRGTLPAAVDAVERTALLNWMLHSDAVGGAADPKSEVTAKLAEFARQRRQVEGSIPAPRWAQATEDGSAVNERLHVRGNHKNLGDEVPRRLLEALGGTEHPAPAEGSGRLGLADQLTDPANPLVARVMVNRLWQHHFGEGIVRSVDNFGVLGQPPTHPELLDWLANEFVRQGWSVKKMHRLMVLSSAYRMASKGDAKAEEVDAQNKLLHRMPVRRLEAEAIRDAMLAVSGRLDRKMYGPGVMPHLTPFMLGRGRPGASGPLDGDGRRSGYVQVRRNFLTPLFLAFDYPVPFSTMGKRTVSNVPAQALTLMNNPFVVQQAEGWAKRTLAEPGRTPKERASGMYVAAFGRPPTEQELGEALEFLEAQAKEYGRADDPRAWADLAHVLLNVKEFLFVN